MSSFAVTIWLNVTTHKQAHEAGTEGRSGYSEAHADTAAIFMRVGDEPKARPGDRVRKAGNFVVDAVCTEHAADIAFMIGNGASDQSERYYAQKVRSMSAGDLVTVETPDGPVTFACESEGWRAVDFGEFTAEEVTPAA